MNIHSSQIGFRKRAWTERGLPIVFCIIGFGAAVYLHWPALTSYATYKGDIRQSPHWAAYHTSSFRADDLLVKYASYNESPLQNLLYYVGTCFIDVVWLTKIIAVLSYGLCSMLFFIIGRSLFGLRGGVLAALFFTFFPDQFVYFVGGFSKAWMIPLLLLCVYLLEEHKWLVLSFLLPFAALAYPMSAVLIGMTTVVYVLIHFWGDRQSVLHVGRTLLPGCLCALVALLVKYLRQPDFIGPMRSKAELLAMPEMYRVGFYQILPIPRLHEELLSHVDQAFVIGSAIIFFLILGKSGVGWKQSWTALFIASIVGYILSDWLFMKLYIPNRYTRYSAAVLLSLWMAQNWDLVLQKISWKWVRAMVLVAMLCAASWDYRDDFQQGKQTMHREALAPMCVFLSHLPNGVLIAAHPYVADDIPVLARRSVLCNYKLAHPWFTRYYDEIKTRTLRVFDALYASGPGPINRLHADYGVTHLVVENDAYQPRGLSRRVYVEPFDEYIRKLVHTNQHFLLSSPPSQCIIYKDRRYTVIRLPLPYATQ